jgi:hypothetical protein
MKSIWIASLTLLCLDHRSPSAIRIPWPINFSEIKPTLLILPNCWVLLVQKKLILILNSSINLNSLQ